MPLLRREVTRGIAASAAAAAMPSTQTWPRENMPGKRVTIFGNSHAYAMARGIHSVRNHYSVKLVMDFPGKSVLAKDDVEPPTLRDEVADWLDTSPETDVLLISVAGSNWLEYCLSNREPKFDLILPFAPELPEIPGAQLVPVAEMRHALVQTNAWHLRSIVALRRHLPKMPIWACAVPPPFQDNERLLELAAQGSVAAAIVAPIAEHGVTDPVLRLKVYLLFAEIVRETYAAERIEYIPPPRAALTGPGFLAPECVHDLVHANGRYGEFVIADIEARLEGYQ
jgi:hypothetical protein